ncbi:MAG: hypothetical protein E6J41_06230 [Chloroflexi bacterium]|nr:MAG: hypothetical protein E6J41_06230 [Chloroflexota bacterium]
MTSSEGAQPAAVVPPSPRFWAKLPVATGNLVQLAGMVAGVLLILAAGATHAVAALSVLLAVLGILAVYLCCHAIAHWLVGRLVGLRFAYIGVRGTDHPEAYPPGLRQVMAATPMFTTVSTRKSRAGTSREALAAYYAAGETSTTICTVLAALLAFLVGVPGGGIILIVSVIWVLLAVATTTFTPKGDYYKARAVLRSAPPA